MQPFAIIPPNGSITDIPIQNIGQFIVSILFIIGIIVAVISIIISGIRFILSQGDKTQIENSKNHLVSSILGFIIILGSFYIVSIVFTVLTGKTFDFKNLCIPSLENPVCIISTQPAPPPPSTSTPPVSVPVVLKQTYNDADLGFSFQYPNSWKINRFIVKKGDNYREKNRIDVYAYDGDIEVIDIKNNTFTIRLLAQKQFEGECGGQGPFQEGWPKGYKNLTILERNALRASVEDGTIPIIQGDFESYPVQIDFKRIQGELPMFGNMEENPYVLKLCYENQRKPLRLKIAYYSTTFTNSNINSRAISKDLLNEMDEIIQSLKINE